MQKSEYSIKLIVLEIIPKNFRKNGKLPNDSSNTSVTFIVDDASAA
jgi:hypothetical protein